jgi:hypothetical protein
MAVHKEGPQLLVCGLPLGHIQRGVVKHQDEVTGKEWEDESWDRN